MLDCVGEGLCSEHIDENLTEIHDCSETFKAFLHSLNKENWSCSQPNRTSRETETTLLVLTRGWTDGPETEPKLSILQAKPSDLSQNRVKVLSTVNRTGLSQIQLQNGSLQQNHDQKERCVDWKAFDVPVRLCTNLFFYPGKETPKRLK